MPLRKQNLKRFFIHNFSDTKAHPILLKWFDHSHLHIDELNYNHHFHFLDEESNKLNNKLIIFNKNNYLVLFTAKIKLSFKDVDKVETLIELTFHPKTSTIPSLKIYRESDDDHSLKLITFSDRENMLRNQDCFIFFKDSFSQMNFFLVNNDSHFDMWLKDKSGHPLLVFSSVDLLNDYEIQLLHYLQLYVTSSHDDAFHKRAVKKINSLLKKLSILPSNDETRLNIRKKIQFNDLLLSGLLNFKKIHSPISHTVNRFIKDIIESHRSVMITDKIEITDNRTATADDLPKIPLLIDQVAEEFCHAQNISNHFTFPNVFLELNIDQDEGHLDYNTATLGYKKNMTHSNELIVGLKINDLGLGFPIVRLLIIGSKGSITLKECAKINAALKYASEHKIPVDWFSCSYGVDISMNQGVEGLDASSSTAREIIKASIHCSVPINIVIDLPNVGAQAYWDAIATILFETNGVIIMTENGSMTLTGHKALTLALQSKIHSMDINEKAQKFFPEGLQNLGGYKDIYGPSGEAMAVAKDTKAACEILLRHHYYSYSNANGKMIEPRFKKTPQNNDSDEAILIKEIKKIQTGYKGDRIKILECLRNPESPPPIQWWKEIQTPSNPHLEHTIIEEMVIGKRPTLVIFTPTGPLAPVDAVTIAKGIYKANGRMPVLIIGNLTGFNSDPEAMKNIQLFSGASIIKAIVDHKGPIIVANLGTLVGGTYVIFSKQLNPFLRIIAVEGAKFQVIGGILASKLIFHKQILEKAKSDPRVKDISNSQLYEKTLREVIEEFEKSEIEAYDNYHSAKRALEVHSIDKIVQVKDLKTSIIDMQESLIEEYDHFITNSQKVS